MDFVNAVTILCQNGLGNLLDDWFFEELQQDLRNRVAPKFWSFFAGIEIRIVQNLRSSL